MESSKRAKSELSRDHRTKLADAACDERLRMVVAARELENALAAPSWHREREWDFRVRDALAVLEKALRETRRSADSEKSLLSEVLAEEPRLEARVKRVRKEYEDLERQVVALLTQLSDSDCEPPEDIRQRVGWLITALKHAQTKETELVYEAFQMDIGPCD